jgi:hypothetical protein
MLTRLIARSNGVSEAGAEYNADDEYEYRDAEDAEYDYKYKYKYEEDQPEPSDATEDRWPVFTNGFSTPGPR